MNERAQEQKMDPIHGPSRLISARLFVSCLTTSLSSLFPLSFTTGITSEGYKGAGFVTQK